MINSSNTERDLNKMADLNNTISENFDKEVKEEKITQLNSQFIDKDHEEIVKNKKTEAMNKLIIDLKLKLDRANYDLTALLDINNIPSTSEKLLFHDITLITSKEFNNIQDHIMEAIKTLNDTMLRVQADLANIHKANKEVNKDDTNLQ